MYQGLLYRLLFITALERLGFHGIRVLVLIFAVKELHYTDTAAFQLTAALMAASFIFSMLSGWIADRFTGQQLLITGGIFLNLLGCSLLLINASLLFIPGICLVFTGTSLFRPNIMVLVGQTADHLKLVKDAAYTLFYIIFNVGALIGIFGCAAVGEHFGWHYAFMIALTTNVLALALLGFTHQQIAHLQSVHYSFNRKFKGFSFSLLLIPIILGSVYFAEYVLQLLPYIFCLFMAGFYILARQMGGTGQQWYWAMALIIVINMIFFGIYEQQSNSLLLFTDRHIDRSLHFSLESHKLIPTTIFQAIDPFYNIFLGGTVAWLWYRLSQFGKNPSGFVKSAMGLILLGFGFIIVVLFKHWSKDGLMPIVSLFLATGFIVCGELLTIPTTMSLCSRFAPPHLQSLGMGIWSLSMGFSEFLAVSFASLTSSILKQCPDDPIESLNLYCDCFWIYGIAAISCGGLILMALPLLRRRMQFFQY